MGGVAGVEEFVEVAEILEAALGRDFEDGEVGGGDHRKPLGEVSGM